MKNLHIDIETFSSVEIKDAGAYKYTQSPDFEILMIAYAYDEEPVQIIDLAQGEQIPKQFMHDLLNPEVKKHAHNATFERISFKAIGLGTPASVWHCSAIKAAYCGLPLGLDMVSKALRFGEDKAKLVSGKALIKYFSVPCKPTKTNGGRTRNLPHHDPQKWDQYKDYCMQDVEAEREIGRRLAAYEIPTKEREIYALDQEINDRGVKIDLDLARKAVKINEEFSAVTVEQVKCITGVDNPNSLAQLKEWVGHKLGRKIKSLAKDEIPVLLAETNDQEIRDVLRLRQLLGKTSVKKYLSMLASVGADGRGRGFFQFYGANRTGRWAGRLVQLQNLPRNYLSDLDVARATALSGDYLNLELMYGNVTDTLSQLIRTAFVAPEGKTFAVADFSAIEARVTAWLADEKWRLKVFNTHGKIYEASAASMFNVPIEEIGKGSDLRQKGKVAELALGYGGSVGALTQMGGDKMGLSDAEMKDIVKRWRKSSPAIVQLWKDLEACAKKAIKNQTTITSKHKGIAFKCNGEFLRVGLPSGRELFYYRPHLRPKTIKMPDGDSFTVESIKYEGMDQQKKVWAVLDTYGGKLVENIVQAIARDLLVVTMLRLRERKFKIVMHVHDEAVCEVDEGSAQEKLDYMCQIMGRSVSWAKGLPLGADGYLTDYYKKD